MASLFSELVVSLSDRISGPAKQVADSIKKIGDAARSVSLSSGLAGLQKSIGDAAAANRRALGRARGDMMESIAAAYGLYRAIQAPLSAASKFEDQMFAIGQKASLSRDQLDALGKTIRGLATTTNQSTESLTQIIERLTNLGLTSDQAATLAGPIGRAATAYKASGLELANVSASIMNQMRVPAERMGMALDYMAKAAKEGGFELKDMSTLLPSMTSAAAQFGLKGADGVARLSAALQVMRLNAGSAGEAAGMMEALFEKTITKKARDRWSKVAGVNIMSEIAKGMAAGQDPFMIIAQRAKDFAKGDYTKLALLMPDPASQHALMALIANAEKYQKILGSVRLGGGTVNADFAKAMENLSEQMKSLGIAFADLNLSVGQALTGNMRGFIDLIRDVVVAINDFVKAHPDLTANILKFSAAIVASRIALTSLRWGYLFVKGTILDLAGIVVSGVKHFVDFGAAIASAVKSMVVGTVTAFARGIGNLIAAAREGGVGGVLSAFASGIKSLVAPIFSVSGALGALGAVLAVTGIVAALIAIAAACKFFVDNREGIGLFFRNFTSSLEKNLDSATLDKIKPFTEALKWLENAIKAGSFKLDDQTWIQFGTTAGEKTATGIKRVAAALETVAGWIEKIDAALTAIGEKWKLLKDWVTPPPEFTEDQLKRRAEYESQQKRIAEGRGTQTPTPIPLPPGSFFEPKAGWLEEYQANQARLKAERDALAAARAQAATPTLIGRAAAAEPATADTKALTDVQTEAGKTKAELDKLKNVVRPSVDPTEIIGLKNLISEADQALTRLGQRTKAALTEAEGMLDSLFLTGRVRQSTRGENSDNAVQ